MVLALCAMATGLRAQHKNDSLLATFDGVQDDSVRIDSMFKIGFKLGATDPMLALWLCDEIEAQPWSDDQPWVRARAANLRGVLYFNLKITDLAMAHLLQAARIADTFGIERVRVSSLNNIGTIQENEGQFVDALQSYRAARAGYIQNKSKGGAILALTNVALVYMDLEQYDKALEVCDSVIQEIDNPEDVNAFARVYGLMGEIYKEKKEYPTALQHLNKSIELAEIGGDDNGRAEDYITRAHVKFAMGMDEQALQDLGIALKMERELGVLPFVVDCYDLYAKIAKKQGNASLALAWMEKSKALSDSIHRDESATALANYQAIYAVKQKDAQIDLLSKDKEIQDANLLNVWYLFVLVSVILLAMILIVVVLLRANKARRRINQELEAKNAQILQQHEQISQQNATLTHQNEQLNILNHEMEGLLHVVAHDLKAPINQMTGILSVIQNEGNLSPKQEKMLDLANRATQNAGNLVKDLVDFGSAELQAANLKFVPVHLNSMLCGVAASFSVEAARKAIAIETMLPETEIQLTTEPDHLRRILENLVSNALKFSATGKKVGIAMTIQDKFVKISIRDEGPGISPADQKNLYRKFHRLSARPTAGESSSGLGLAIVKALVKQLGGEIGLESALGLGSTFTVTLPRD